MNSSGFKFRPQEVSLTAEYRLRGNQILCQSSMAKWNQRYRRDHPVRPLPRVG